MPSNTKDLINWADMLINPEIDDEVKYELLKDIYVLDLSIHQLQKSRIGRSVKKCSKMNGKVRGISKRIIKKWEEMIESYCKEKKSREMLARSDNASVKVYQAQDNKQSFQDCLNTSVINKKDKECTKKRKHDSLFVYSDEVPKIRYQKDEIKKEKYFEDKKAEKIDKKKTKSHSQKNVALKGGKLCDDEKLEHFDLIKPLGYCDSNQLTGLTDFNIDSDGESFDQSNIMSRSDMISVSKPEQLTSINTEEIDVTSKFSSERKVWVPKSKCASICDQNNIQDCEYINGVSVAVIATYNAKQLLDFENDNKKVIRQTSEFWQKLFSKNFKLASKFENEKWRDAYFRIEAMEEEKLKQISDRLNKKTEASKQNETRAKLINEPYKLARKFGSYRR